MSKLLKGAMVVLMIAGFTGCVSTSDIKVESVKSEKVDLKGYKTYQILEESGVATESRVTNLDVNAELQRIINTELGKKGKIPVTNDPDFYVAYLAGTDMDAIKVKVNEEGQETIENVPAAAMILLLVDAETGVIIGEVKNLPLEDRKKRLSYTIKKMLSDL
jgi:phosphoribosyl-ATP pyrophosphohydrolase